MTKPITLTQTPLLRSPSDRTLATIRRGYNSGQWRTGQDVSDLSAIEDRLAGFDACFFCLGVSAVGMKEEEYRRLTFDLTVSVARTLAKLNPTMTFIYVSGAGTDSTERRRLMWARVKGRTENALLQMPFEAVFRFRPAYIQPLHLVAEHGMKAGYVRNIERDPPVRLKLREGFRVRWHMGPSAPRR